ncbi:hypothetical protein AMECASPLE_032738 [Ameca splendens]|uniref:Uncharacterized protein n=1 Tax=Ameca splendens TaxID=208324 RepID=A0ABV0XJL0_9TELE
MTPTAPCECVEAETDSTLAHKNWSMTPVIFVALAMCIRLLSCWKLNRSDINKSSFCSPCRLLACLCTLVHKNPKL